MNLISPHIELPPCRFRGKVTGDTCVCRCPKLLGRTASLKVCTGEAWGLAACKYAEPPASKHPAPTPAPQETAPQNVPEPPEVHPNRDVVRRKSLGLGDAVEKALEYVGITSERVQKILPNCGCAERKKRLNELGAWAIRAMGLGKDDAEREFEEIAK